ncbi:MipA/OmpV family protein [Loktanella sp. Alg231-35]|uniref:MipA/OmpV family protein n=1 Tax=Loktanella sp. Alg231-35 TaxID=1922220 RepID=UPI00131F05DF|nr:MipA/OmpV family protein [Loktanella sp. Alg231-35]
MLKLRKVAQLFRIMTLAALVACPLAASAQDGDGGISFRFGLGPSLGPGYFGDEDTDAGVGVKFKLEELRFGGLSSGGGADNYGLGFGGSFRFIGGRDADDFDELSGLADIDPALEIGGGLEFTARDYEVFAKVRYGVIGHESFVAVVGGDLFYRPTDQLTFRAGPRVLLGDDDYAQTYFGVSPAEGLASSFESYDARGGIISAGAKAEATYAINDDWEVVGTLRYDQLRDDAAGSPITQSDEQLSGSIVLTRRITLGF